MTEDFLKMSFGNFIDYIKNEVYGIQRYIEVFHNTSNDMQSVFETMENPKVRELLKLTIVKHADIMLAKFITFAVNNENMVCSKIDTLVTNLNPLLDNNFSLSYKGFLYLNDCIVDAINIRNNFNPYSRKDGDFDFEGYLNTKLKEMSDKKYEDTIKSITGHELKEVIKLTFAKLSVAMLQLKRLMERSRTISTSATIAKVTIDLMITTYVVCTTINIAK